MVVVVVVECESGVCEIRRWETPWLAGNRVRVLMAEAVIFGVVGGVGSGPFVGRLLREFCGSLSQFQRLDCCEVRP